MMISHKQVLAVLRQRAQEVAAISSDPKQGAASQTSAAPGLTPDGIELSGRAQDTVQAQRALRDLPDVRQDRVDSIRAAIESGNYHVSPEDVAEKILSRQVIETSIERQEDRRTPGASS